MKATRLGQDLARVHEATDRAKALDAVQQRLDELTAGHGRLAATSADAKAKGLQVQARLAELRQRLATARSQDGKESAESDF